MTISIKFENTYMDLTTPTTTDQTYTVGSGTSDFEFRKAQIDNDREEDKFSISHTHLLSDGSAIPSFFTFNEHNNYYDVDMNSVSHTDVGTYTIRYTAVATSVDSSVATCTKTITHEVIVTVDFPCESGNNLVSFDIADEQRVLGVTFVMTMPSIVDTNSRDYAGGVP